MATNDSIRITVLFFSFAAERMNTREESYEISGGATIRQLFHQHLEADLRSPITTWLFSCNEDWVEPDHLLNQGDAVAVIPPVSGG